MIIKAEREQFFKLESNETRIEKQHSYDSTTDYDTQDSLRLGHIRKMLYYLSRHHLESNDWKKLARFWNFTEEQIKGSEFFYFIEKIFFSQQKFCPIAIEHQYTGKTSYKDHAYRMLLIWLHGLSSAKDPLNELYDALIYIDKEDVTEKMRKKAEEESFYHQSRSKCRCLPAIPSSACHYCTIV